jgi:class 3 adenylate cyclase
MNQVFIVVQLEKSRFQLFGDTVNTTTRIKSSGEGGKLHLSRETAEIAGGQSGWVVRRESPVLAKGKGELNTFWLAVV